MDAVWSEVRPTIGKPATLRNNNHDNYRNAGRLERVKALLPAAVRRGPRPELAVRSSVPHLLYSSASQFTTGQTRQFLQVLKQRPTSGGGYRHTQGAQGHEILARTVHQLPCCCHFILRPFDCQYIARERAAFTILICDLCANITALRTDQIFTISAASLDCTPSPTCFQDPGSRRTWAAG